ncbi:MAG: succinate dehydrogenase, cytochrome b556 subunit [Pseudomonadota bacterium]|jgi:succinate dehydrogenase / fumarate reductase cytochrome b subunit
MSDATRTIRERPTSPHLQVWRWHITMATSILHRATGVALYVGALILAAWATALASGPEAYGAFMGLLASPLGRLVMFGLTFSVFFHLAKGVQHLVWDMGAAFRLPAANAGAVAVIAFSVVATLVVWIIAAMTGAL